MKPEKFTNIFLDSGAKNLRTFQTIVEQNSSSEYNRINLR